MSDLSVQQQQQLNLYLKKNPKVSREKAIKLLFGGGANQSVGKGVTLEHSTQRAQLQTIYLQSGRKIIYTKLKDGRMACKYYGADGTQLKPEYFKKVEGQISISPDGASYTVTKNGKTSKPIKAKNPALGQIDQNIVKLNNQEKRLKKTQKEQGFIGKGWDWFKNKTGIGDGSDKAQNQINAERDMLKQLRKPNTKIDSKQFEKITGQKYTKANVEKFKKGELSQASQKVTGYQEGQEMAVDVAADVISGVASFTTYTVAVAAAPFTGGASIALGVAVAAGTGALVKSGVKAADAFSGGRKYTFDDLKKDAGTGAVSGMLAPVTSGIGGAVGKVVATKLGLQTVKTVGKEIAEDVVENSFKQTLKTSLQNPGAFKFVGEGSGKKVLAYGSEVLTDGALNGGIDNGFRTAVNGGSLSDVAKASGEGALYAPLTGAGMKITAGKLIPSGFKLAGKLFKKINRGFEYGKQVVTEASNGVIERIKNKFGVSKAKLTQPDLSVVTAKIKTQFGTNSDYDKSAIARLTKNLTKDNAGFVSSALDVITKRKNANYRNISEAMGCITKENQDFALWVIKNKNIPPNYWGNILKNADSVTIPEFKALLKNWLFAQNKALYLEGVNRNNIDLYKKYYNDKRFLNSDLTDIIAPANKFNKSLVDKFLKQYNSSDRGLITYVRSVLKEVTNEPKKVIAEKLFPEGFNTKKFQDYRYIRIVLENTNKQNFGFLSKCIDSKKLSLSDIKELAVFSNIDTQSRMTLLDRTSLLQSFNTLSPQLKKTMQDNGIDILNLENFLKGQKVASVMSKTEKSQFLKNIVANNNESKILKADFSNNSNNGVREIINDVTAGIPEFKAIADTPKGLKTLQTLQKIMKSSEYKSFSDMDKTICKFSILLSELGESPEKVLKNYKLGNDATTRIIDILRNKRFVVAFLDGKMSEKAVVANYRNFSDYKVAEFLLKANPAYASKFTPNVTQRINNAFNNFYSGQKMLFTSHFQNNGAKFPKANYKGNQYRVLNLNTLGANDDLSKYGFAKGTTPSNVTFNVHMTDDCSATAVKDIENMLLLTKDHYNDLAPSSTLVKGYKNPTFMGYQYGVILKNENRNLATFGFDTITGNRKNGSDFVRLLFDNKSNQRYKTRFTNLLKSKFKIDLTDAEYVELVKQIQSKKYITHLHDVKIGNKIIKAEQLKAVINECMNNTVGKEITSFNPTIEAIYAKVSSLEECPDGLLLLAKKYDLPIVLGNPDS